MKIFLGSFLIAAMIFAVFGAVTPVKAQSDYYIVNLGTVANNTDETAYVNLDKFAKSHNMTIDSITLAVYAEGEADFDGLKIYPGFVGQNANVDEAVYSTDDSTVTLTINIDSANTAYQIPTGGTLNHTYLAGYNALKLTLDVASSGTDATDPSKCWIMVYAYGKHY